MADIIFGKLGTHVTYFSSNGKQKTALVVGDPNSVVVTEVGGPNDGAVPPLAENERHLVVFSPTGAVYLKQNVPVATTLDADYLPQPNHWVPQAAVPSEA